MRFQNRSHAEGPDDSNAERQQLEGGMLLTGTAIYLLRSWPLVCQGHDLPLFIKVMTSLCLSRSWPSLVFQGRDLPHLSRSWPHLFVKVVTFPVYQGHDLTCLSRSLPVSLIHQCRNLHMSTAVCQGHDLLSIKVVTIFCYCTRRTYPFWRREIWPMFIKGLRVKGQVLAMVFCSVLLCFQSLILFIVMNCCKF